MFFSFYFSIILLAQSNFWNGLYPHMQLNVLLQLYELSMWQYNTVNKKTIENLGGGLEQVLTAV